MPAPSIEALFAFEDEIESAIQEMFTAIPYNCYRQRDADSVATPFVTVQLSGCIETGEPRFKTLGSVSVPYPQGWTGTLTMQVVTKRGAAGTSHTTELSKVRRYMAEFQARLTSVELRYHGIREISATASSPQIAVDEDHDVTSLSYSIKWMILTGAWPTLTP